MRIKHCAVLAGLVGTLALGGLSAPASAYAEETTPAPVEGVAAAGDGTTDDFSPASTGVTVPTDYDKADFYEAAPLASALSAAPAARVAVTGATDEMKYFTLYESGQNYDQGFSKWDGYHAMGYYQFDRRYSLVSLMRSCYEYDPVTFAMFKPLIDRAAELSSASTVIFDAATGRLTEIGQLAEDAWHAAYAADPATFAALQDAFAISNYYQPTERWLKSELGIDMSGRADCVKGLVWSLTNLFGTSGVQKYLGAANLTNEMSDREFVNAIVDSLPSSLAKYNKNTKYHQSWINRYEKERATCLSYIAEDEEQASQPGADEPAGDVSVDNGNQGGSGNGGAQGGTGSEDVTPGEGGTGNEDVVIPGDGDANSSGDGNTDDGSEDESQDDSQNDNSDASSGNQSDNNGSGNNNNGNDSSNDSNVNNGSAVDNDAEDEVDGVEIPAPVQPTPPASNNAAGGVTTTPPVSNGALDATDDASSGEDSSSELNGAGGSNNQSDADSEGSENVSHAGPDNKNTSTSDSGNGENVSQKTGDSANTTKDDAGAQKRATSKKGLPQTGDVAGAAALATAGMAVLGGASLAAGKRLMRIEEDDAPIE